MPTMLMESSPRIPLGVFTANSLTTAEGMIAELAAEGITDLWLHHDLYTIPAQKPQPGYCHQYADPDRIRQFVSDLADVGIRTLAYLSQSMMLQYQIPASAMFTFVEYFLDFGIEGIYLDSPAESLLNQLHAAFPAMPKMGHVSVYPSIATVLNMVSEGQLNMLRIGETAYGDLAELNAYPQQGLFTHELTVINPALTGHLAYGYWAPGSPWWYNNKAGFPGVPVDQLPGHLYYPEILQLIAKGGIGPALSLVSKYNDYKTYWKPAFAAAKLLGPLPQWPGTEIEYDAPGIGGTPPIYPVFPSDPIPPIEIPTPETPRSPREPEDPDGEETPVHDDSLASLTEDWIVSALNRVESIAGHAKVFPGLERADTDGAIDFVMAQAERSPLAVVFFDSDDVEMLQEGQARYVPQYKILIGVPNEREKGDSRRGDDVRIGSNGLRDRLRTALHDKAPAVSAGGYTTDRTRFMGIKPLARKKNFWLYEATLQVEESPNQ